MTKLDAVNIIMESLGESKVSSLTSGVADAEDAEAILDEVTADILDKGWSVNSEFCFKLSKDNDGKVAVPAGATSIDPSGPSAGLNLVPRDDSGTRRLYDVINQTFVIDQDVYVDMVLSMAFEDLPRAYQKYIAICAAEVAQSRIIGSVKLDAFLERQKMEAWAAMLDAESDASDDNILRQSESVRFVAYRNNCRALR